MYRKKGLDKLHDVLRTYGLDKKLPAISRKAKGLPPNSHHRESQWLTELINRKNNRRISPEDIAPLAEAICEIARDEGKTHQLDVKQLEIELSLHFGWLPQHILGSNAQQQRKTFRVLRGLLNAVTTQPMGNNTQDAELAGRWLDSFEAQLTVLEALATYAKSWKNASDTEGVERTWRAIESNWDLMQSEQKAWAAILRAEALKSRGLSNDALIFLKFAQEQFSDEAAPKESKTRVLRYRLHTVTGDTYRELGRDVEAIRAYENALRYALNESDVFRMERKRFNALLRVGKLQDATDKFLPSLEKAFDSRKVPGTTKRLSPMDYARTGYALAWHSRMRGGKHFKQSQEILEELLREKRLAPRVRAIGEQYRLETLLRMGDLEGAKEIVENDKGENFFPNPGDTRRSFSHLIYGRVYFYHAMLNGNMEDCSQGIQQLDDAETLSGVMGANARRAQVLIERGKFLAFLRGFGSEKSRALEGVDKDLKLAQQIIDSLGTFREHIQSAIQVNTAIVDFIKNVKMGASKDQFVEQSNYLKQLAKENGSLGEVSAGHKARIYALAAANQICAAGGIRVAENMIQQSAQRAQEQGDYMTLLDCRWLLSFCTSKEAARSAILDFFDKETKQSVQKAKIGAWMLAEEA